MLNTKVTILFQVLGGWFAPSVQRLVTQGKEKNQTRASAQNYMSKKM